MSAKQSKAIGAELIKALTSLVHALNTRLDDKSEGGAVAQIKTLEPETKGLIAEAIRGLLKFIQFCLEQLERITLVAYHTISQIDAGLALVQVAADFIDQMPSLVGKIKNELSKAELTKDLSLIHI